MPNVKLSVDSFSLSRGTMNITGTVNGSTDQKSQFLGDTVTANGAFSINGQKTKQGMSGEYSNYGCQELVFDASRSWTGISTSASPKTSTLGSGTALDITPAYYTCHMWLRLS